MRMLVNTTEDDGFILLGFFEYPNLRIPLFVIFLLSYILSVVENVTLVVLIYLDSHLHKPMYFFLYPKFQFQPFGKFSKKWWQAEDATGWIPQSIIKDIKFVENNWSKLILKDICFTSFIFPKFILTFLDMRLISYEYCLAQMYLFIALQSNEILILTVMSYDRYVAICNPLRYHLILSRKPIVDHLFCDLEPLLQLLCGDVSEVEYFLRFEAACIAVPSFFLTLISYVFIILVISKIQTTEGHLHNTKSISLLNTLVIPMLNPLLYSLRNKEVKGAFTRSISRIIQGSSEVAGSRKFKRSTEPLVAVLNRSRRE
ncbi:olfactory receptor 8A1-like [Anomaloglossus baeobatrachus]|uniref:olfactory receptor 8A1-like n=1 Tax=Anomaloglossus baeobatrachus TaxID=238106 RepID=UPI003F50CF55